MSTTLTTRPGQGLSATVYASRDLTGYTTTVELSTSGKFSSVTTKTPTAAGRQVNFSLSSTEVDSLKDCHYRVKATKGGATVIVEDGNVDYIPAPASGSSTGLITHDSESSLVRWAPPPQISPTVYTVSGVFQSITAGPNEDVIVFGKAGSASTSSFQITGGRHVRIIGGKWAKSNAGATLRVTDVTGSVFIEGVDIDASGYNGDAINACGVATGTVTYPDVYIQNCRIYGVNGTTATVHGDVFQPQGPIGRLFIDKLTGSSNYQGFFISPQNPVSGAFFSRCNFIKVANPANQITYQLWFNDGNQNPYPVTLDDVYVAGPAGQSVASDWVWPKSGLVGSGGSINGQAIGALTDADGAAYWPAVTQIGGKVYSGSPANGDFVPSGTVGIGYSAKGYLTVAAPLTPRVTSVNGALPDVSGNVSIAPSFETNQGFCYTMPPYLATTAAASSGANRTFFMRLRGSKFGATAVTVLVGTGSGNISVGIYANNGQSGRNAAPGVPKATTGSVAMTATGNSEQVIPLGSTINVVEGDWVGISVDNVTATLGRPQANTVNPSALAGLMCAVSAAFPVPTSAPTGAFLTTPFWYAQVT